MFYKKNERKKPQNLKKMLRKFQVSNASVTTFKGAKLCQSFLKVTKLSNF